MQTENGFKIKNVTLLEIKTPSGLATSSETEDDAVHITAYTVADAENKSFLAAEAVKEAERVSKIAEETESMLLLVKEINEQCNVRNTYAYLSDYQSVHYLDLSYLPIFAFYFTGLRGEVVHLAQVIDCKFDQWNPCDLQNVHVNLSL